jgi:hypothetical protein
MAAGNLIVMVYHVMASIPLPPVIMLHGAIVWLHSY